MGSTERVALLILADNSAEAETDESGASEVRWRHGRHALLLAALGFFGLSAAAVLQTTRVLALGTKPAAHGGVAAVSLQQVFLDRNRSAERIVKALERDSESVCAAQGESCSRSRCCRGAGLQCYAKDAWWAQCLPTCTPGPNVVDQASPSPWECEALGNRTPGTPESCSDDGEDCRQTKCCKSAGTQCFRKHEFWAACLPQCTPGPHLRDDDWHPWSCEALGPRTLGAAPWVAEQCAKAGEPCAAKGCCAEPGMQCYTQNQWHSQCRPTCEPGATYSAEDQPWECKAVGMRTPMLKENSGLERGVVAPWVKDRCSAIGENCLDTGCCHAVGHRCFRQGKYWAQCKLSCSTEPDPTDGNKTWDCEALGPESWGLALKGDPSLYCISLFMPSSYEGPLLKEHLKANAGIFECDGYAVYAADSYRLGRTKDGVDVEALLIPKIPVGISQDGTAGNAKLFMAVWDKVIAENRFRNFDFTLKVDPDAVLIPWRIRDHLRPHTGSNSYVVNCNKFPNSPNFPMMFGALEVFSLRAMDSYARGSWKCGTQLPWHAWGEDYYMTHCLDFLGVGRLADFGILGDNVCTGANCADPYTGSFHPFKSIDSWMQCWGQAMTAGGR